MVVVGIVLVLAHSKRQLLNEWKLSKLLRNYESDLLLHADGGGVGVGVGGIAHACSVRFSNANF